MTFVLDVLLSEGQFSSYLNQLVSPMWIVFSADGLSKRSSTPSFLPNSTVRFNYATRLVLNLPNIDNAFLKVYLCTVLDSDPTKTKALAYSKILLNELAPGICHKISIPLMDSLDHRREAALLSIQVSLNQTQIRNTYPAIQRQEPAPAPNFYNHQRMTYIQRSKPPV